MLNKITKKWDLKIFTIIVTFILVSIIGVISVGAMFISPQTSVFVTEINNFENKNSTKEIKTDKKTIGEFLDEQNIGLSAHDILNHNENLALFEDMEIVITRGRSFTIAVDSHLVLCSTTKATLGEALLQAGYYPDEDDLVSHDLTTPITEGLTVSITRVNSESAVVIEAIPNTTEYIDDPELEKGKTRVVREGYSGECEVTFSITYNNGVETAREEVSRIVTKEPQNKIIANGTKVAKAPTPAPTQKQTAAAKSTAKSENTKKQESKQASAPAKNSGSVAGLNYTKKLTMSATGYTAFRSDGSRGTTASGRKAGQGIVAVDPRVIPLGTRVYVEGYGEAIAADTGGGIKGNKIDLCFEMSNAEIRQKFGRKTVTVYILD